MCEIHTVAVHCENEVELLKLIDNALVQKNKN